VLDDFRSDSHLDSLNSLEEQSLQILIEIVSSQHFFKMTVGLKLVSMVVCFQMIPIVSQSEITDSIKSLFCLIGISNNQTSALQCLNLLCQRHRLFGISHVYIQKMSRWVRCSYGKRAGFVAAKIGIISENSTFFETFLPISAQNMFHKPCERLFLLFFWIKRYIILKILYLCIVF